MNYNELYEVQTAFTSDVAQIRLACGSRDVLRALRLVSEIWLSYAEGMD